MKPLLIDFAYDSNKNAVNASEAIKGEEYYCPNCGVKLVFKNSGKTGKGTRRPHFAHPSGSNCNESPLHAIFKDKVVDILQHFLERREKFDILCRCVRCGKVLSANVLQENMRIQKECWLAKEARPDIALIDANGQVYAVIEIVVTHGIEDATLNYYKKMKIAVFRYDITDKDIQDIERRLHYPNAIYNTVCPYCSVVAQPNKRVLFMQSPPRYSRSRYIFERGRFKKRISRL
ncbi:MAG: hypothetical protein J6X29_04965 [Clostridia bacterium]|nr:hypothetical protein [Clostridia bacterium]